MGAGRADSTGGADRRSALVRLFLGCVVVAAVWVWWVDGTKKEPLVREASGVTALVRSSADEPGPRLTGQLVVAPDRCLAIDLGGTVSPVIWPFSTSIDYDGQGITDALIRPRPAQNPPRADAHLIRVGEFFTGTGSPRPAARVRESFPDTPDQCLDTGTVVVLDSLEGVVPAP